MTINRSQLSQLNEIIENAHEASYSIIIFNPSELRDINPRKLENFLGASGNEYIAANESEEVILGDTVTMPEPNKSLGDCWKHGGFSGVVTAMRGDGLCTVTDMDDDGWDIEIDRLERE